MVSPFDALLKDAVRRKDVPLPDEVHDLVFLCRDPEIRRFYAQRPDVGEARALRMLEVEDDAGVVASLVQFAGLAGVLLAVRRGFGEAVSFSIMDFAGSLDPSEKLRVLEEFDVSVPSAFVKVPLGELLLLADSAEARVFLIERVSSASCWRVPAVSAAEVEALTLRLAAWEPSRVAVSCWFALARQYRAGVFSSDLLLEALEGFGRDLLSPDERDALRWWVTGSSVYDNGRNSCIKNFRVEQERLEAEEAEEAANAAEITSFEEAVSWLGSAPSVSGPLERWLDTLESLPFSWLVKLVGLINSSTLAFPSEARFVKRRIAVLADPAELMAEWPELALEHATSIIRSGPPVAALQGYPASEVMFNYPEAGVLLAELLKHGGDLVTAQVISDSFEGSLGELFVVLSNVSSDG